jgi:hypothetical protein
MLWQEVNLMEGWGIRTVRHHSPSTIYHPQLLIPCLSALRFSPTASSHLITLRPPLHFQLTTLLSAFS